MTKSAPAPTLSPGAVVDWRYRVLSLLGRGGMSSVYRAHDHLTDRDVALKILTYELTIGGLGTRFDREARNASRLDHPGCVRVLEHGSSEEGCRYLTMELLSGPTLRAELDRVGPLSVSRAVAVVLDLLDALSHAHGRGVLHRDVKPENIVLHPGRTVLIDFGLSVIGEDAPLTAAGTCVGSPSYMAPERLLEENYDARADVYAVGVVLYELLAGRPPFTGKAAVEIAQKQVDTPPPPLLELRGDVPLPLARIVHRALDKDPDERPESAAAMASALRATGTGRRTNPSVAVPPPASAPPPLPRLNGEAPRSISTCVVVELDRPSLLRRIWAWLRYGRWRRPGLKLTPELAPASGSLRSRA